MHINLTTPMSDDKERLRHTKAVIDAIERYTEERMNEENTDGSRSGGQPVLLPCPFCGATAYLDYDTNTSMFGPKGEHIKGCVIGNWDMREYIDEHHAIAAWNTRQPTQSDAEIIAENKRLREALANLANTINIVGSPYHKAQEALDQIVTETKRAARAALQEQSK